MKNVFLIAVLFVTWGCNAPGAPEARDSSYQAITDSSQVTKDSLAIPDSATQHVTH